MTDYTPPTQDEIARVAAYWQRAKLLGCQHLGSLTFNTSMERPSCSECGEGLNLLSDIQIEEMRSRPPLNPDVRDDLIAQIGSLIWTGHCLHPATGPGNPEDAALNSHARCGGVKNVALMLRATEGR